MSIEHIFRLNPYQLNHDEKREIILPEFKELVKFHYENNKEYQNILNALEFDVNSIRSFEDIPFVPVRLFKEHDLYSVSKDNIVKVIKSSGTTNQISSKIYLDKETAFLQQKALIQIVSDFTGKERVPMLILDSRSTLENSNSFSTRAAGILGFSNLARSVHYALDENMNFNDEVVNEFIQKHKHQKVFLFGFTYIIWEYFYKYLLKNNKKFDFSNAVLIHGGGWKRLIEEKITTSDFNSKLNETCGIQNVYQNYGMAEQTGSIFVECKYGHFHVSNFSEVIIRCSKDFSVAEVGVKGIIQVLSILPKSYIGHSLLTEDEGTILGEDDCECGRYGKYFSIEGRVKSAELRGCSDTYVR